MSEFTIYFAPGTCARVSMIALEEIGASYEARLVSFVKEDHRSDAYRRLNPKSKVPLLLIDGAPLTETTAILTYLDRRFPEAALFPPGRSLLEDARILADMAWCASGLHPLVTRMRLPQLFCAVPEGQASVQEMAARAMHASFSLIEDRLSDRDWMLGSQWSALDAYFFWIWFRSTDGGFDASPYPRFEDHAARMTERPSTRRVLAREQEALDQLERAGLTFNLRQLPT